MIPAGICSKCHEDFMNCKCEQFHPNIPYLPNSGRYACLWCNQVKECRINKGNEDSAICIDCIIQLFHSSGLAPRLFDVKELKALYRIIEYHYINYEDQEAHDVVNKIVKILKENESVSRSK